MKYVLNTRLEKEMNYIPYQVIYKETLEISTKKKMIKENNKRVKERQVQRENERGNLVFNYQKRQWIYLDVKNVRKDRLNKKLDHKYWGLFQVKEKINNYSYKLKLSRSMRIHLIFNTNRLKSYYEKNFEVKEN